MATEPLPWLTKSASPFHPTDRKCPACRGDFDGGFAYLSAGALLLNESGQDSVQSDSLRAFFSLGYHGSASDMSDSDGVEVVEDLQGGQFDLQWCSIACMRAWFVNLTHEIEGRIRERRV